LHQNAGTMYLLMDVHDSVKVNQTKLFRSFSVLS